MPSYAAPTALATPTRANVYPARPCQWCGESFTARSHWQEVEGSGAAAYMHVACAHEWQESLAWEAIFRADVDAARALAAA